jgi:hypothetical protein
MKIYIEMPINIESKVLARNSSMCHELLKQIFQRDARRLLHKYTMDRGDM